MANSWFLDQPLDQSSERAVFTQNQKKISNNYMLNQSLNVISEKTYEKQESTEEKEREQELLLDKDASSAKVIKLNIIQKSSSMV